MTDLCQQCGGPEPEGLPPGLWEFRGCACRLCSECALNDKKPRHAAGCEKNEETRG